MINKAGTANTRATTGREWRVFSACRKMEEYRKTLPRDEQERALKSGTWSNEQLAALQAAGLKET